MNFSKREQILFGGVIVCVVCFLTMQFGINPVLNSANSLDDNIQSYEARLVKLLSASKVSKEVDRIYEDMARELVQQQSDSQTVSTFIANVQNEARKRNIQVLNLKPQRPTAKDNFAHFSLDLTISGQWCDILEWARTLQSSPYWAAFDRFRLESASAARNILKGSVSLQYFRLKND